MQPLQRMGAPNVRFRERKPNRLQELLGTADGQAQIRAMAERLNGSGAVGIVRAALFLAGGTVPGEADTVPELAQALRSLKWTPVPICFSRPAAGDVFFQCDDAGQPAACGFVAKAPTHYGEGEEPWFLAFDGAEERPVRRSCREVTFWMRGG